MQVSVIANSTMPYNSCMNDAPKTHARVTVNLVERAVKALDLAVSITHDSKTDTINRALQVYAYVLHETDQGGEVFIHKDGETSKITFL